MTTNSLRVRHRTETGHEFINPVDTIEILKIEDDINIRKLFEELQILKEKKKNTNLLMNIKTEFNNEDAFSYILQSRERET